jgi:hypothetical protein
MKDQVDGCSHAAPTGLDVETSQSPLERAAVVGIKGERPRTNDDARLSNDDDAQTHNYVAGRPRNDADARSRTAR